MVTPYTSVDRDNLKWDPRMYDKQIRCQSANCFYEERINKVNYSCLLPDWWYESRGHFYCDACYDEKWKDRLKIKLGNRLVPWNSNKFEITKAINSIRVQKPEGICGVKIVPFR